MQTEKLTLQEYDNHRKLLLYFNKSVSVPAGVGNKSKAYFVVASDSIKVHLKNAILYESLNEEYQIQNDTAHWELVTDGTASVFPLSNGVSWLYIENTSATEEAILNITGVAHA